MSEAAGELPEHLVRMSSFHGGEFVRCTTCGAEADRDEEFEHHERCPEADDD